MRLFIKPPAHTSQQNGVAECKHRHILDVAQTMIIYIHVLKYLSVDTVLSVCYLINRMPSLVLYGKIPFPYLYPNKSIFSVPLHVFSFTCFVRDFSPGLNKLSPRSIKCVFVGYSQTQKGYRYYSPSARKYFVSADVTFFESAPYFSPQGPVTVSESISFSPFVPLPTHVVHDVSSPVSLKDTIAPPAPKPPREKDFRHVHSLAKSYCF